MNTLRFLWSLTKLAFVGSILYGLVWTFTASPAAQQAQARRDRLAGDKCAPGRVVAIRVSVARYPANWRHIVDARNGRNTGPDGVTVVNTGQRWPTVLTKNDEGEEQRRRAGERMSGLGARPGLARDEYPPAEGRSTDAADFRYVDRRQNSAQGASMGGQLRPWCNGQRYKLVAAP